MSIDVMTKVIQRCPLTGSPRLAMIVMANWCDDEGESLYPSVELIAEAMQVSRSQAQRVLHSLMPAGRSDAEIAVSVSRGEWWIRVVGNENGGRPGATRRYELNVARLDKLPKLSAFEKADQLRRARAETGRMDATRRARETGRMDATPDMGDGSHGCDPTGRMDATPRAAPVRPDSSYNHHLTVNTKDARAKSDFDLFWSRYPHKVARTLAKIAFEEVVAKVPLDVLLAAVDRYVASKPPDRQWCNPARWLTDERWADEPATTKGSFGQFLNKRAVPPSQRRGGEHDGPSIDGEVVTSEAKRLKAPPKAPKPKFLQEWEAGKLTAGVLKPMPGSEGPR